ncbi:MAG: hypothetical protein JXR95_13810 [Deltaproteobacteria bacterium]|nr:hypothetical protein [Deltaproteobacteria bacterium]
MIFKTSYIIVTGSIGVGKTTFLNTVSGKLKSPHVKGITFTAPFARNKEPSNIYFFNPIGIPSENEIWAKRNTDKTWNFNFDSLNKYTSILISYLEEHRLSTLILDDIGPLELQNNGFNSIMNSIDNYLIQTVIIGVKKSFITDITDKFKIENPYVIDLDQTTSEDAMTQCSEIFKQQYIKNTGIFSGYTAIVETGFGSLAHAWKIPLRGHILSTIQAIMLISFGGFTKGKGIFRISFLTAFLKIFSPLHNPIKPMFFIWLQGSILATPIYYLGWNIFSVIAGSVLMGWSVTAFSLATNYLLFGEIWFTAINNLSRVIFRAFAFNGGFFHLILFLLVLKALISSVFGFLSYKGYFITRINRIKTKNHSVIKNKYGKSKKSNLESMKGAFKDFLKPGFFILWSLSIVVIILLTQNSTFQIILTVLRSLAVTLILFFMIRKIDINKLTEKLEKGKNTEIKQSIIHSLAVMQGTENKDKTQESEASSESSVILS